MAIVSPLWTCAACANVSGGLNLILLADVHRRLQLSQFHNESYEFRRPVRLSPSLRRTGHQRSQEPLSALRTSRCVPRLERRIAVDRQRTLNTISAHTQRWV